MDYESMTVKMQEAILSAQNLALKGNHQEIVEGHLLLSLAGDSGGLLPRILDISDVSVERFRNYYKDKLAKLPEVTIPGEEQRAYLSSTLQKLLDQAYSEMKNLGDEYLSVEHCG